ncbi:ABC transporter substrate-binding protein [Qipengyuania spongiae]|uniref:ABC transporter substrate-binding protein n=1 Tax=Qipengyuania spongiae TaxID=2909673 RepID=A0ABY5T5C1_9SPHN|nr:ABC transporter substrate-binding protein [Qipengyuania spongiae]UVI40144.1 ABC transporter substrate-binding protein [Qipengyuania spongiae]
MRRIIVLLLLPILLLGCGDRRSGDVVDIAIIGDPAELGASGLRLGPVGQHVRTARAQGLVRLDETGQVVPAIAERWIVTDDGTSYIFRIREFDLPGGERLTARAVRNSLRDTIERLRGTSMGLDFGKLRDIRAMAGRVVEIRLKSPMPELLQLLAQPEMGLAVGEAPIGPMIAVPEDGAVRLAAMSPEARGLPRQPGWEEMVRTVRLSAVSAQAAVRGFADGRYDVVLGGTLSDFALAEAGPLSRGTIRLNSTIGLFGLDIRGQNGFLATPENREMLSMALDRTALIQPFNIAGWNAATTIVPDAISSNGQAGDDRWAGQTIEQRRERARAAVTAWARENGELVLRIALPDGPGSDILLRGLAAQWGEIGVRLVRITGDGVRSAGSDAAVDLVLRERVARFGGALWFLNQFNCTVTRGVCSEDVDFLVDLANNAPDPAESESYMAEAETALEALYPFIPIGAPIRWSMVRADVEGFAENPWALHPLFPLSRAPI